MNRRGIIFLLLKIVLIALILFLTNKYLIGFYIVDSIDYKSINIKPHDFLIYCKLIKEYQNNDIVFYKNNIYRVIGTKGQILSVNNNEIIIDNEKYSGIINIDNYPYTINKDKFIIMNSKTIKLVSLNELKGKLIFRLQIRDF